MPDYSNLFVVILGMGIVFIGLICLIVLVMVMGKIISLTDRNVSAAAAPTTPAAPVVAPAAAPAAPAGIQPEVLAAITAVMTQEFGYNASRMEITYIRKI